MNPSSPQPEASNLPGTAPASPQLEASALPGNPQTPLQLITQEIPPEPEQTSSPVQETRIEASVNIHTFISTQQIILNSVNFPFQDHATSPPSSLFIVSDPAAEKDEASSNQVLSEENQARLKEVFSWLQKDAQDQVRHVDHLDEIIESIDQELPDDIKASLEPISHLDNHYAAVRRALRNQSSKPALEQKRAKVKEFVKESQAQIQSSKELLTKLQPTLELKIARKAALEAKLKTLTTEIEADRKKIAELPGLIEKIQKDTSAAMIESNQLKTKLSTLSNAQETYQQLLENINQMTSNTSGVIAKYFNIGLH
jgi:DNA repair exonuclease SbcCD ATPase subunit